jgi:hypothetical protein
MVGIEAVEELLRCDLSAWKHPRDDGHQRRYQKKLVHEVASNGIRFAPGL